MISVPDIVATLENILLISDCFPSYTFEFRAMDDCYEILPASHSIR